MHYVCFLLLTILCSFKTINPDEVAKANLICGKWQSSEKNLTVEVYPYKNTFKAKIIWFSGGVSKAKPMETIMDIKNPNPTLHSRKVLGLDVVENLQYDASSNSWEGGKIYEVQSGKYWSAAAGIDKTGLLKVKGYWKVKLLGKTMTFNRIL
ncbi:MULTISPECIES: DUF2147 domain-containing protein [unclassified Mucilaginibacter]|uniref:DUF2147 domain-containing protein n=1 Tax=unclassified Mucilaginibacter TaxID=2617802 RepID=UPI002AC8F8A8|nr:MULTISPECIES: DUF2147 domain-containing protein [unclassified Mucilaginibacter]MEB0261440.1 DUF2147 domain-containing protein [Mucilaginibacter sp. 10I4]MEB0276974.1 DUF2147 domain-containing protein [Mucilaginibacter sp. 10B2]MEB0301503.1 DUF2147 domain-containing protein [Mucilaginibacter sp. 5C4]WPX25074.1 DUF2147 domain-containing protein [Mucilaginibacter sp. 5C4]